MSQRKDPKKKVVVKTTKPENNEPVVLETEPKKKVKPTVARSKTAAATQPQQDFTFGKENYILMAVGAGLVFLGLALMSGGQMPSPDVWDDSIIYSFRRTVLAPLVIIIGLVVEIFAIFKGYNISE